MKVRAKKHLGQHFLNDNAIAERIVNGLRYNNYNSVVEIGPGMGVLTQFLIEKDIDLNVFEIDRESVDYLQVNYPQLIGKVFEKDFLKVDFTEEPFHENWKGAIIGNFPYNISSQILFKVLENRNQVPEVVGMFQKEVAERIASPPGSKSYGVISVLLQAYYDMEYLFTVEPESFNPPPKVRSGVIRLTRNNVQKLDCDEVWFKRIVKATFNQRRKTIRNGLKSLPKGAFESNHILLTKRPEQLSVTEFIELTKLYLSQANL